MRLVPLLAAAASAVLVGGLAAPASAATQNRTDRSGDVRVDQDNTPESAREGADIESLRGVHGGGELRFTVTVDDLLVPGTFNETNVIVRMRTAADRDFRATLSISEGLKSVRLVEPSRERVVECDGLVGRAVAAKDQYVVIVPRACVSRPRDVVFGAQTLIRDANGEGAGSASDDARRNGQVPAQVALGTTALVNN